MVRYEFNSYAQMAQWLEEQEFAVERGVEGPVLREGQAVGKFQRELVPRYVVHVPGEAPTLGISVKEQVGLRDRVGG